MARDLKEVSATGNVVTGPVYLHSCTVTGGGTTNVGTLVVKDGSGGATRLTLKTIADGSGMWTAGDREGVLFSSAIHATITGTSVVASFEFS